MALPRSLLLFVCSALTGYLVCLAGYWQARAEENAALTPPPIVLAPLGAGAHTEHRQVDTRVRSLYLRRLCDFGRCELLAGAPGQGFSLLASYPSDRWVGLDERGGGLVLVDITDGPPTPRAAHDARGSFAVAAALLGFLGLLSLFRAHLHTRQLLRRILESRPAEVRGGRLVFLDSALPRAAALARPLEDGPAIGLCASAAPGEETPYRDAPAPWFAIAGSRDAELARLSTRRGALLMATLCSLVLAVLSAALA